MDTTASVRATGPATPVVSRPDPALMRQAVRTDLPPAEAVVASAEAPDVRLDLSRLAQQQAAQPQAKELARGVVVDHESKTLVYRVTDERTGEVVAQVPDEVLLRLRAYVQAVTERHAGQGGGHKVERVA